MDMTRELRWFRSMVLIRKAEEAVIAQYKAQDKIFAAKQVPEHTIKCPTHLSIGQEAAAVGLCDALTPTDLLVSSHRSHAHYLAKGGSLMAMMAELFGRVTGCSKGKGGSMHLVDASVGMMGSSAIVGGSLPLAVGFGLTFKMRGERRVSVACFGDAAVEQGVFHESMHFASLHKLPVIFFCENNGFATLSPISSRQHVPIHTRAASYVMPSAFVDGNDIVAVSKAAWEAAERARSGQGPTLIECETYRWMGHVGADSDAGTGPRTVELFEQWKRRCPVEEGRRILYGRGVPDADIAAVEQVVTEELAAALAYAKASPAPRTEEMFDDI